MRGNWSNKYRNTVNLKNMTTVDINTRVDWLGKNETLIEISQRKQSPFQTKYISDISRGIANLSK